MIVVPGECKDIYGRDGGEAMVLCCGGAELGLARQGREQGGCWSEVVGACTRRVG